MKYTPIKTVIIKNEYNPEWVDFMISMLEDYKKANSKIPLRIKQVMGNCVRDILKKEKQIQEDNVVVFQWNRDSNDLYVNVYEVLINELGHESDAKVYSENGTMILETK